MFEEIRRVCALHEQNLISDKGLITALDYAALHRRRPPKADRR